MPHHVYANNNEVASKSADGTTTAIATDVCISPGPPPPPGGVPVPYNNTCFAKDLARVTKTVLIQGKGAALENYSYFSTSVGDEPATFPLKKGVVSGALKGKGFFQQWSMNVKAEAKGVARHVDIVTHNHTNMGNTGGYPYLSVFDKSPSCRKDRDKIKRKCATNRRDDAKGKKKKKKKGVFAKASNLLEKVDGLAAKGYGYKRNKNNAWIDQYCDGLWIKPVSTTIKLDNGQKVNPLEVFKNRIENDLKALEKIANSSNFELVKTGFSQLVEVAKSQLGSRWVTKKLLWLGAKAGLKSLIGGVAGATGVGLVITAGTTAWTIADVVNTATSIAEKLGPDADDILKQITDPDAIRKLAKDKVDEYRRNPEKALADAMTLKAKFDPCIRMRKCKLVPYNKTGAKDAAKSGQGCCPGQTGHHVIPDSMVKGNPCYKGKGKAPVICLEGANNSHGSHGQAHAALKTSMSNYRKKSGKSTIDYEAARDQALDAITKPFGASASHCSRKCLREQLDAYYKDCKGKQVTATSGSESDEENKGLGGTDDQNGID